MITKKQAKIGKSFRVDKDVADSFNQIKQRTRLSADLLGQLSMWMITHIDINDIIAWLDAMDTRQTFTIEPPKTKKK